MFILLGELVSFLYVTPEYVGLVNRLAILLTNPFNRAIRGKNKKRSLAKVSLGYSGRKVICCRPGGAQQNGRLLGFLSDSQCNKSRTTFIADRSAGNVRVSGESQR